MSKAVRRTTGRGGDSPQIVGTPDNLLEAVEERWGPLEWDLACLAENAVAPNYLTPEDDSLSPHTAWPLGPLCWLNPPYHKIKPWVQKAYLQSLIGCRVIMLIPASVESDWFARFCYGKALVIPLADRPKFKGYKYPAAAPHMLLTFGLDDPSQIMEKPWRWKL